MSKAKVAEITGRPGLIMAESKYRKFAKNEIIPVAKNTSFLEVAEKIMPDRDGQWANHLFIFESRHTTTIGSEMLAKKTLDFLNSLTDEYPMDILSISSGMDEDKLVVVGLIRLYCKQPPRFSALASFLGEKKPEKKMVVKSNGNKLVIPAEAYLRYTEADIADHEKNVDLMDQALKDATDEMPFLNRIDAYIPRDLPTIDPSVPLEYDLLTKDMQISTILCYEDFIKIFTECMRYINGVERDSYYATVLGKTKKDDFWSVVKAYIHRNFIDTKRMEIEDVPMLIKKLNRALFDLYIVQDLIDDPDITDVKITDPYSIRVRVKGKAYLSNVTFIDDADYNRFIKSIAVKNGVDLSVPSQTFTDAHDKNYILRFSITSPYITASGYPIIHIRKVSRKKLMAPDLIRLGMFDEKVRDYLIDAARTSRGICFAGPPGSGKTVCLNWFLDQYEDSAEVLVIQENDELFSKRKGIMFEHVVNNPQRGEQACSLEDLGKMALVAGANVFVIGEAKGGEICSAITLSNSGCRTAITIHSPSATETIDKMADLAMRGYANSYDQAKRMIKSFQTIVYMQDFKVQEITEIIDYDTDKKDMVYRPIYKRSADKAR